MAALGDISPCDQPKAAVRWDFIDQLCTRFWAWAVERQRESSAQLPMDPHILRDIGLIDTDTARMTKGLFHPHLRSWDGGAAV